MSNSKLNTAASWFKELDTAGKAFLVIVALPTVLAALYYGLIASDIYISVANYSVRSNSELPSVNIMDTFFSGGSTSSTGDDAFIVRDYILSRDMLVELDSELDLRNHYQSKDIDIISRLDNDASTEEFYEYYLNIVEVNMDSSASIGTLKVRAFTPEFSQLIASRIISKSEELVNSMTERIVEDTLRFTKDEVANATQLVRKTSDAMSRFRNESKTIDPGQETAAVMGIITRLETELALARAELLHTESYMKNDSIQIKTLRSKIESLDKQISNERQRLTTGNENTEDYTQLIYNYEPLLLEKALAERQYASTLNSLELARAEAHRKQRYLIPFVTPMVPDEAVEPERFIETLTVFFASFLTYAIGGLIWAAIKDHMRN